MQNSKLFQLLLKNAKSNFIDTSNFSVANLSDELARRIYGGNPPENTGCTNESCQNGTCSSENNPKNNTCTNTTCSTLGMSNTGCNNSTCHNGGE